MTSGAKPASGDGGSEWAYAAFLSYSHQDNQRLAATLHRSLERFTRPWFRRRALRVFWDVDNLAANQDLWGTLDAELDRSHYFVLLASPKAKESGGVRHEVQYWRERHPAPDTFLIALGPEGKICWDSERNDFDWEHTNALPEDEMRGWFRTEPKWEDLTWVQDKTRLSLRHPEFRSVVRSLAARIHEKAKDELDSADLRQHRKAALLGVLVSAVLVVLLVASLVTGHFADEQHQLAASRQLAGLSQQLAAESLSADQDNPLLARQLAATAWRVSPTGQAANAMSALLTGQEQEGLLIGHSLAALNTEAFSQESGLLATGSASGTVQLWNLASRTEDGAPFKADGTDIGVLSVAFNPSGTVLATAGGSSQVRLWDPSSRREIGSLTVPSTSTYRGVNAVAFSPNGSLLATAGEDGMLRLWDAGTRIQRGAPMQADASTDGADAGVNAVAFSPNGKVLASAGQDGTIRLWNPATHAALRPPISMPFSVAGVTSLAFSPDGSLLAAGDGGGQIQVWNTATWQAVDALITAAPGASQVDEGVDTVVFSPSGSFLATSDAGGTVRFWNPRTGRQYAAQATSASGFSVRGLVFEAPGDVLATAGADGTVRLLDPLTLSPAGAPITTSVYEPVTADFAAGDRVLATATGGGQVYLLNTATDLAARYAPLINASVSDSVGDSGLNALAVSPNGTVLATAGYNSTVQLWNAVTGREIGVIHTAQTSEPSVLALAFSPDGAAIATGDSAGFLKLWNARTRSEIGSPLLANPNQRYRGVQSIAFSPAGTLLATGGSDGLVRLWNPQRQQQVGAPMTAANIQVHEVAFSPDGRMLITVAWAGALQRWNVATREKIGPPIAPSGGYVNGAAFSPDGRLLATAETNVGGNGYVRLWDPATGREIGIPIHVVSEANADKAHYAGTVSVAFNVDGSLLATTGGGTTQLWETALWTDPYRSLCNEAGNVPPAAWPSYAPGVPYYAGCP